MIIKRLQLRDFRNYEEADITFSAGVNLLYGDNAQGKTNILEAAFLCATTKSIRGSKDREMIRFDREEAHICAYIERQEIPHKIDIHLKKNRRKGLAVDGIPVRKSADLLGLLHAVSFSPDDLSMMKNGPEERRRFLDLELCQTDKIYCSNLADYNRTLQQRNDLLKQIGTNPELKSTLAVWDEQLVRFGTYIIKARRQRIADFLPIVTKKHSVLTEGKEELKIFYEPDVSEEAFGRELALNTERDIILKFTSVGPHRDDMRLEIDGNNVRLYGSQGQKRTAALSLKLAEIEFAREFLKDTPVLLLDDVLSELDRGRQLQLLNEIKDIQTIVTCTGMEEFVQCRSTGDTIYRVGGNRITLE